MEDGSLKENEKNLAHTKLKRRAGTNSFSNKSFEKRMLAKEAETNSFSQSLSKRNLSLRSCLRIFLLCSFQLVCAALLLGNSSFRMSLPTESFQADQLRAAHSRSSFQQTSLQQEELVPAYFTSSFDRHSLQPEELAAAYCRKSFEQQRLHQDELQIAYLFSPTRALQLSSFEQKELHRSILVSFDQLDLEISLSFPKLGSTRFSYQLQADSFERISFEHRASLCAALLYRLRIRNRSGQSLQLQRVQLGSLVQGGAFNTTLRLRASSPPLHCTASTLTSLSLAIVKPLGQRAWRRTTLPALTLSSLSLAMR